MGDKSHGKGADTRVRERRGMKPIVVSPRRRRFGKKALAAVIAAGVLVTGTSVAFALRGHQYERPLKPVAVKRASFDVKCHHLQCDFTDKTQTAASSWEWSFGDGDRSGSRSPTHLYRDAGTFLVRLRVHAANGRIFRLVRVVAADEMAIRPHPRISAKPTTKGFRLEGTTRGWSARCSSDAEIQSRTGKHWSKIDVFKIAPRGGFGGVLPRAGGTFRARLPFSTSKQGVTCEASLSNVVTATPPAPPVNVDNHDVSGQVGGTSDIPPTNGSGGSQPACPAGQVFDTKLNRCLRTDDNFENGAPING